MEKVREAVAGSQDFMSSSSFDPWDGICSGDYSTFVDRYCGLFDAHLKKQKETSPRRLRGDSKQGRKLKFADDGDSSTATCSESVSWSSVVGAGSVASSSSFISFGKQNRPSTLSSLLGRTKTSQDKKKSVKEMTVKPKKSRGKGKNIGKSANDDAGPSSKD